MQTLQLEAAELHKNYSLHLRRKNYSPSQGVSTLIFNKSHSTKERRLFHKTTLYIFFFPSPLLCSAMRHTCCSLPSLTRKSSKNYLDTCSTTNKIGTAITKIKLLLTSTPYFYLQLKKYYKTLQLQMTCSKNIRSS